MSLLRLAGCENVARGMEYLSRRLDQILALLGVLPEPIRKGDAYTTTLPMTLRSPRAKWGPAGRELADVRSSEQRLAVADGNTRALPRRPGGRTGAECGLDGVGDDLGGLGVDGDVAAEQHAADDLPSVPGRVLETVSHVSSPS